MQGQIKLMPYILVAVIATIFGMSWAYLIAPPIYTGVNPNRLNDAAQQQWIINVAVASSNAASYSDAAAIELVNRVPHPHTTIQAILNSPNISSADAIALQELLVTLPPDLAGTSAPALPSLFTQVMQLLIPIVIVFAVALIFGKILVLILGRNSQ